MVFGHNCSLKFWKSPSTDTTNECFSPAGCPETFGTPLWKASLELDFWWLGVLDIMSSPVGWEERSEEREIPTRGQRGMIFKSDESSAQRNRWRSVIDFVRNGELYALSTFRVSKRAFRLSFLASSPHLSPRNSKTKSTSVISHIMIICTSIRSRQCDHTIPQEKSPFFEITVKIKLKKLKKCLRFSKKW